MFEDGGKDVYYLPDFGNPGKEYEKTKHNVGFRAIDILAKNLNIDVSKNKFDSLVGEGNFAGQKIILIKPQTYMNLSGNAVEQIMAFYKVEPKDLLVIYDDIDLDIGKLRIRKSGGPGTHNGMRNIVQMISSQDFARIRLGTGKPIGCKDLASYVLSPFTKEEDVLIQKVIEDSADATISILEKGIDKTMNEFNK